MPVIPALWEVKASGSQGQELKTSLANLVKPRLKKKKSFYYKDTCTRIFIAAMFTIAKIWNQPKYPSVIDWIKKMWHINTMEYYADIKKSEFMSFVEMWMKLETIILNKLTQEQKTKHHMFLFLNSN